MQDFRLGFIGAGFVANFHAVALQAVRGAQISAVHALKGAEEFSAGVKQRGLGECRVCKSVEELCDYCDAVAILAPNFVRVEIMEQIADAVEKGAEVQGLICEKPLGRTVADARRLVELVHRTGLPNAYFENNIHMKPINKALLQLSPVQQAMGPLTLSRTAEEHCGPHEPWFWDPTRQGGGVLSDMGCHSIAVGWYLLTPVGEDVRYLKPVSITVDMALLKWGVPKYRQQLLDRTGVDYGKTPAEDFCTGTVNFRNPDTGQLVKSQFTNSWMFDKQGLRLFMDGMGPGYAFELNTLRSPLEVFVGDEAAQAVADAERAVEKATASHGLIAVQPNEADLYGYVDEIEDAIRAFREGRNAKLDWEYGLEITKLCQAGYMAAERRRTIDLTDPAIQDELGTYESLISQGKGADLLL